MFRQFVLAPNHQIFFKQVTSSDVKLIQENLITDIENKQYLIINIHAFSNLHLFKCYQL